MSNWDLGAGLCLALHLTEINTEVSIPLNPVLPCVMGKWDCCIANWCSLVNCREETGEAGIRKVTEPGLKHIQIWKCRVPDPRSWLYYSKLQQRVRMGLLSQFWGWADYEGLEWELVWENECILGVGKATVPAQKPSPPGLFNEGVCSHYKSCLRDKHRQAR